MEKITDIEEGVRKLLSVEEYDIPDFIFRRKAEGELVDRLIYQGEEIPLFDSRYDPRVAPIAEYGSETEKNSALNVYSFSGKDVSLSELMLKEMDIAEYVLHTKIRSVTAFVKPDAASMILVMEDGTAANIDVGTTMAPGSRNQCQHRLVTSKGEACDRGAGEYTTPSMLSVFRSESLVVQTYDDDQFYLYGLPEEDVNKAVTIFSILAGRLDVSDWKDNLKRYQAAIAAVYESDRQQRTIVIGE